MILFISAKEFGKAQSEYVKQGNKFGPLDTNYTILEGNNAKALEMGDGYTDSQYEAKGLTVMGIKDINPTNYQIIEEGQTEDGDDYIVIAPATQATETTEVLPTNVIETIESLINEEYISVRWTEDFTNDQRRNYSNLDGQTFATKEQLLEFYERVNPNNIVCFEGRWGVKDSTGVCAHGCQTVQELLSVIEAGHDIGDYRRTTVDLQDPYTEVIYAGEFNGNKFVILKG